MKVKAITAEVYRSAHGDCSNGGLSSQYDSVLVLCEAGQEYETDTEMRPFVRIEDGPRGTKRAVPVDGLARFCKQNDTTSAVGPMMGGAYIACSDSRFGDMAGFYGAVALHDRFETAEQYRSYD